MKKKYKDEYYLDGVIRYGKYGDKIDKLECIGLTQAFDLFKKKYNVKK